jgi:acetyl-CoA/propionyl-CoA carboxylase biotin carboxyl carrier protein
VTVEVDGKRVEVSLPTKLIPAAGGGTALAAPPRRRSAASVNTATGDSVAAPMQATIVKLAVAEGDTVVKGDLLLVLEAMKMEQPITAHKDGTVTGVNASVGATVSAGHVLLSISD